MDDIVKKNFLEAVWAICLNQKVPLAQNFAQ